MSTESGIEWTDMTWSVVTGCTKTSAGCRDCWAKREVESRWTHNPRSVFFGRPFEDVRVHPEVLTKPLAIRRPKKVFVCPRADLFHESVPFEFIVSVFGVMALAQHHAFQVLTKRPARMRAFFEWLDHESASDREGRGPASMCRRVLLRRPGVALPKAAAEAPVVSVPWPLPNVWIGVSGEDQASLEDRILDLLYTPASVRWLSLEPLIGPIDLHHLRCRTARLPEAELGLAPRRLPEPACVEVDAITGCLRHGGGALVTPVAAIDWVVVGGEVGKRARHMEVEWVRVLREQCRHGRRAFFMKQWGDWVPRSQWQGNDPSIYPSVPHLRVGKRKAGRLLDGVLHDEFPRVALARPRDHERRLDHECA